jgi:probable HAF family extracellular repeat protein
VGYSYDSGAVGGREATEWNGGNIIDLSGLPGSNDNLAYSINDAGQAVGFSYDSNVAYVVEWSGASVTKLGLGVGYSINDAGQVVGQSGDFAAEWSDGNVIDLGGLPDSNASVGLSINDAGQVVGYSQFAVGGGDIDIATEWSDGNIINLGGLPGSTSSQALAINDAGQVVGVSAGPTPPPVPEPSSWAMMLVGFAGLGLAGWRAPGSRSPLSPVPSMRRGCRAPLAEQRQ